MLKNTTGVISKQPRRPWPEMNNKITKKPNENIFLTTEGPKKVIPTNITYIKNWKKKQSDLLKSVDEDRKNGVITTETQIDLINQISIMANHIKHPSIQTRDVNTGEILGMRYTHGTTDIYNLGKLDVNTTLLKSEEKIIPVITDKNHYVVPITELDNEIKNNAEYSDKLPKSRYDVDLAFQLLNKDAEGDQYNLFAVKDYTWFPSGNYYN